MKKLPLLLLFLSLGMLAGGSYAMSFPEHTNEMITSQAISGGLLASTIGYLLLSAVRSNRQRKHTPRSKALPAPQHSPQSFRRRLAGFLHRDETEVLSQADHFISSMPFWSAITAFYRRSPKSTAIIRAVLTRIKKALTIK